VRIWVDADACPRAIQDILLRASRRLEVELIFVANKPLRVPSSPHVRALRVRAGSDEADRRIIQEATEGDLVITADVPLAAEAVGEGLHVLSPRGELFTEENVGERLAMRDLMDDLRSGGLETGGPAAFGRAERQAFANQLDRLLARLAPPARK
jgi:uncharacterized protein YaiI (UPF0178 family)